MNAIDALRVVYRRISELKAVMSARKLQALRQHRNNDAEWLSGCCGGLTQAHAVIDQFARELVANHVSAPPEGFPPENALPNRS